MTNQNKPLQGKEWWEKEFDRLYCPKFNIWRYVNPDTDPGGITAAFEGQSEVKSFISSLLQKQAERFVEMGNKKIKKIKDMGEGYVSDEYDAIDAYRDYRDAIKSSLEDEEGKK